MGTVKEKLNSSAGMSILVALLAFLAAAMVSLVVIVAAMNNESRITDQQTKQQNFLAATSAATELKKQLVGVSMEKRVVTLLNTNPTVGAVNPTDGTTYSLKKNDGAAVTDPSVAGKYWEGLHQALKYLDTGSEDDNPGKSGGNFASPLKLTVENASGGTAVSELEANVTLRVTRPSATVRAGNITVAVGCGTADSADAIAVNLNFSNIKWSSEKTQTYYFSQYDETEEVWRTYQWYKETTSNVTILEENVYAGRRAS